MLGPEDSIATVHTVSVHPDKGTGLGRSLFRLRITSMLYTLLIVILILALLGGLPTWGYHEYGYYPSGGIGLVLLIVILLVLFGRL